MLRQRLYRHGYADTVIDGADPGKELPPTGAHGVLTAGDVFICYTIELPWLHNCPQVSCIPEGRYPVLKRYSTRFQWHLHLTDVPGRELILMHPANHAQKELKGCIAPVTEITGIGQAIFSRKACGTLMEQVEQVIQQNEPIFITIRSLAGPNTHL